jgi:hypothetical protein
MAERHEDFFTSNSMFFARLFNHGFTSDEQAERTIRAIQAEKLTWEWVLSHSVSDTLTALDKIQEKADAEHDAEDLVEQEVLMDFQPKATPAVQLTDPRKVPNLYLSMLNNDQALFDEWLVLYDAAVARGSAIPHDVAWIEFKRKYSCVPSAGWITLVSGVAK